VGAGGAFRAFPWPARDLIMPVNVAAPSDNLTAPEGAPPSPGIRSLGRHAVLYAIGNILSKAIAFVMLPVYTRYLTPADYGIAALIEMTLDVIAMIGGAQIAQGVFRFYHKAESSDDKRAVISTAMSTLTISYAILGTAVFLSAAGISRILFGSPVHADLVRLSGMTLGFQGLQWVPLVYGRVLERSGLVVGANIAKLVIAVTLNLVFVVGMKLGIRGIFLSSLASSALVAIWLGVITVRQVGLRVRPAVLKSLVRFGVPLIGVQMATFTMTFSDRYFLQAAGDESMVGLYNLAYQFGFLLLMLGFVPIEMVWGPRRFQVARTANPSPVLAQAFRLINVSVFTIGVGIALFVGDLLRVMATPPFHPAADVVPVLLVAYVFHGWAMMQDLGVLVTERTEFLTIANWVAAVVALAAFAILVPRFYAAGAASAAVLAFGARWGLTYRFSQRLWPVAYDWVPIIRLAGLAIAITATSVALPAMPLPMSIGVHLLFLAAYLVLLWTLPILTQDERRRAVQLTRSAIHTLTHRRAERSEGGEIRTEAR
jgi:O-antigen/teichoic acid export membrane protein